MPKCEKELTIGDKYRVAILGIENALLAMGVNKENCVKNTCESCKADIAMAEAHLLGTLEYLDVEDPREALKPENLRWNK